MKLLKYSAHNVLKVSDIDFDLAGRHLFLVGGRNGQGKTSALTALLMALCGRSGMDWPEIGLKEGEDKGWVKVHLSGDEELQEPVGFTLELFLRRRRSGQVVEEFRILDSAGEEAPEPRTLLKRLYEMRAFDPLAFERLDRRQKKSLLQQLLGLDFAKEKAERKRLYDERSEVNRSGVRLKGQIESMPFYADAPKEEIPVAELMEELIHRQEVNKQNAAARKRHKDLSDSKDRLSEKVERLRRELAEAESELQSVTMEWTTAEKEIAELADEDTDEVRKRAKEAESLNEKVRANQKCVEAQESLASLRKTSERLTDQMKQIDAEIERQLAEAEWPVEGLGFDEEGVLYQGLPFEQASKSERVLASVRIGMALNPKLRLLVCQDGNDLDNESLKALEEMLQREDFQMLVECVTRSSEDEDRCAVVIEDGGLK